MRIWMGHRHCEERLRRSNPFFLYAARWIASLTLAITWISRGVLDTRLRLSYAGLTRVSINLRKNCFAGWIAGSSPAMTSLDLTRRFQPLFRQQPHRRVGVHRLAEGKALRVFAAQLIELDRIRIGLGALGDDVHAEVVGERDDRFQDHRAGAAAGGADERLVDLDGVERETLQIGQRGMAGA